ncbi:carboxymuconolactone decarboxylase family protein [Enterococcus sp. AZ101]|uniref:carboxymuconolactone decarboxylase family protein n=1 Tax=Enterococcus sp. AZ101 TaxID=2774742 RepID=UPI003D267D33
MTEKYEIGLKLMDEIIGESGTKVRTSLRKISPDFEKYLVEFPFGDIYSRGNLSLKSKELITIAALTAIGHVPEQLEVHIAAAIKSGWTEKEILDTMIHLSVYCGFPNAINGLNIANKVFNKGENHE